jgi:hypothetical protein
MNFDKHLFRASSLGNLMSGTIGLTEKQQITLNELSAKKEEKGITAKQELTLQDLIAKSENKELTQGVKTFLKEEYISAKYNRKKDIQNKYLEKGLYNEEDSLDLLGQIEDRLFIKNDNHFKNDYVMGTPDNVQYNRIVDTKSSWDIFTFHKAEITSLYEWQLRAYMWLTDIDEAALVYCLTDTPQHIIYDECRRMAYKKGVIDWETDEAHIEVCQEIEKNMTYSDIPVEEKVKIFKIERCEKKEKEIIERVELAREWLNNYKLI